MCGMQRAYAPGRLLVRGATAVLLATVLLLNALFTLTLSYAALYQ